MVVFGNRGDGLAVAELAFNECPNLEAVSMTEQQAATLPGGTIKVREFHGGPEKEMGAFPFDVLARGGSMPTLMAAAHRANLHASRLQYRHWSLQTHGWCTAQAQQAIYTVLLVQTRLDRQGVVAADGVVVGGFVADFKDTLATIPPANSAAAAELAAPIQRARPPACDAGSPSEEQDKSRVKVVQRWGSERAPSPPADNIVNNGSGAAPILPIEIWLTILAFNLRKDYGLPSPLYIPVPDIPPVDKAKVARKAARKAAKVEEKKRSLIDWLDTLNPDRDRSVPISWSEHSELLEVSESDSEAEEGAGCNTQ